MNTDLPINNIALRFDDVSQYWNSYSRLPPVSLIGASALKVLETMRKRKITKYVVSTTAKLIAIVRNVTIIRISTRVSHWKSFCTNILKHNGNHIYSLYLSLNNSMLFTVSYDFQNKQLLFHKQHKPVNICNFDACFLWDRNSVFKYYIGELHYCYWGHHITFFLKLSLR
jgi:hypothetical protein